MRKKNDKTPPAPPAPATPTAQAHTPLADLLKEKGFATTPAPAVALAKPSESAGFNLARAGKIVLRREKKGHGGKTVTVVSGLEMPAIELEHLAKAMRKGLGCGSTVEQGAVMLQGDIQQRAQTWLREHGATKIVLGN